MLELVLARHGETDYNAQRRAQGQLNIPLNSNGLLQAQEQANQLGKIRFDAILSSDLKRSLDGAILHAQTYPHLSAEADGRWRERSFGDHEGKCVGDLGYGSDYKGGLVRHFYECPCPNGEPMLKFVDRIAKAINETYESRPNQRIILHSHGGLIMAAINYLLKEEPKFENNRPHNNGHVSFFRIAKTNKGIEVADSLINVPCYQLVEYLDDNTLKITRTK